MNIQDIIGTYIKKDDFQILGFELIDNSYNNFCEAIMKNNLTNYSNFLSSVQDVIAFKKFLNGLQNSNPKNKDYLSVLENCTFYFND